MITDDAQSSSLNKRPSRSPFIYCYTHYERVERFKKVQSSNLCGKSIPGQRFISIPIRNSHVSYYTVDVSVSFFGCRQI